MARRLTEQSEVDSPIPVVSASVIEKTTVTSRSFGVGALPSRSECGHSLHTLVVTATMMTSVERGPLLRDRSPTNTRWRDG